MIAVNTNLLVYAHRESSAFKALEAWISVPSCELIGEEPGYFETLGRVWE